MLPELTKGPGEETLPVASKRLPPDPADTSGAKGLQTGIAQCFVCEKPIAGDHWFAQVKHGNWTVRLCCSQCSKLFFTQRLPGLRRVAFLAALRSLAWPTQSDVRFNRS